MLEVGNGGMTTDEYISHFSLWALLKAPLVIGCDITNMDAATKNILMNEELIAINQDSLGISGARVVQNGNKEIWAGPLSDGYVIILFNKDANSASITADFETVGYGSSVAHVRDLWLHEDLGIFENSFTAQVNSHGVVVVKLT